MLRARGDRRRNDHRHGGAGAGEHGDYCYGRRIDDIAVTVEPGNEGQATHITISAFSADTLMTPRSSFAASASTRSPKARTQGSPSKPTASTMDASGSLLLFLRYRCCDVVRGIRQASFAAPQGQVFCPPSSTRGTAQRPHRAPCRSRRPLPAADCSHCFPDRRLVGLRQRYPAVQEIDDDKRRTVSIIHRRPPESLQSARDSSKGTTAGKEQKARNERQPGQDPE